MSLCISDPLIRSVIKIDCISDKLLFLKPDFEVYNPLTNLMFRLKGKFGEYIISKQIQDTVWFAKYVQANFQCLQVLTSRLGMG
jgi:hypothetical protein